MSEETQILTRWVDPTIDDFKIALEEANKQIEEDNKEIERLNNKINKTTQYVQSLSSKGRGCDIYEDIKQEILQKLKGDSSNE